MEPKLFPTNEPSAEHNYQEKTPGKLYDEVSYFIEKQGWKGRLWYTPISCSIGSCQWYITFGIVYFIDSV
jgi:hypothetical protein